jgi:[ribosomal protein S5]-alanine N-acetyltransferase
LGVVEAPAQLETPRLLGERIGPRHHGPLLALLGDPRVGATLGGTQTPEGVTAYIEREVTRWSADGMGYWMFRSRATGASVARGGLSRTHVGGRDEIEIGWAVMPEHWGQGYATELGAAAIDVAFGVFGAGSVVAYTLPHNAGSRRVMEKLGFGLEREVVYAGLPHVLYRLQSPRGDRGARTFAI